MIKPIGLIMKKFSYDDEYRPARTAAKAMGSGFSRKNDEECATKLDIDNLKFELRSDINDIKSALNYIVSELNYLKSKLNHEENKPPSKLGLVIIIIFFVVIFMWYYIKFIMKSY
jgi:hypothetical protein